MKTKAVEVFGPNIEIDICQYCNGIWLDDGELKKVLGDRKLASYLTKKIGTKARSAIVCPHCGGLMDTETAEDIVADVCLGCHGVWLDIGELGRLKGLSRRGFAPDAKAKNEELFEELVFESRQSPLNRLLRRLSR